MSFDDSLVSFLTQIDVLERQNSKVQTDLCAENERVNSKRLKTVQLDYGVNKSTLALEQAKKSLTELQQQLSINQAELAQSFLDKTRIENCTERTKDLNQQIRSKIASRLRVLKEEEQRWKTRQQQAKSIYSDIEAMAKVDELKKTLKNFEQEMHVICQSNLETNNKISSLSSTIEDLKQHRDYLLSSRDELSVSISELSSTVDNLESETVQLKQKLARKRQELRAIGN
ncbi:hypothetical protein RCL1_000868 [Eukaryota sp. TZLM3-RCL]